jgi:hypothetical protein
MLTLWRREWDSKSDGPIAAASYRSVVAADAKLATDAVDHCPVLPLDLAIISFPATWRAKGDRGASAAIRSGFQSTKAEMLEILGS